MFFLTDPHLRTHLLRHFRKCVIETATEREKNRRATDSHECSQVVYYIIREEYEDAHLTFQEQIKTHTHIFYTCVYALRVSDITLRGP